MPNDARPSLAAIASRPRVRRTGAWLAASIVAFAAIGFLLLPPLVRPMLERSLSSALDRKVSIERLNINPFALSATLSGVSVGDRSERVPMLKFDELYANTELMSLLRWAPVIGELKLTRPSLHLVRNEDKSYNFSDLLERMLAQPPGPPPQFSLSNIQVVDGSIDFDDGPEHKTHKVAELNIGIPFLSSLPSQTEIKVEPRFSARINGQAVAMTGETRPFLDTHETVLHWDIAGLPLPLYLDYLPVKLPAKVESGRLDARLDLTFVGRGEKPPQLSLAGDFALSDLAVNERSGASLLRVPSLAVAVDKLDLSGNNAELRSIKADGLQIDVRRERAGELNLATLSPPAGAPAKGETPFRYRIGSIVLNHGVMRVIDQGVAPAYASTLNDVSLEVKGLGSGKDQKATVALSFVTDAGEKVSQRGSLSLSPVAADGHIDIAGLKLPRLFPYYANAINRAVDDGALDLATDFRYGGDTNGLVLTNLEGTVRDLLTRLPDEKQPLWRIPALTVRGGTVDFSKQVISVDSIESQGAALSVRRDAEGTLNMDRFVHRSEPEARSGSGQGWRVDARKLSLSDVSASFADESVTPPAIVALTRLSLNAENLSNAVRTKGQIALQATVNKRGTVSLSGPIETAPFGGKLNAVAKNIDLLPFQAYISRQARLVLTGGTASAQGTLDMATGATEQGGFKGDLVLSGVTALDEANQTDLLKWKTLSLKGIDSQLEPLAVTIGDIALDDFFARLILNETGEFNLQQLGRKRAPATAPPTPTAAPKTVEVASPPTTATTWLKLGKATLTSGNIYFTDHFIRPNYSANLTQVAGGLSSLAFDKPADLELHGRVQDSAPVDITGRINPLAKNLFLDIKANASDIELPPLSPYSGKYVGYGIEKGKLAMKVHYLIDERKLTAENTVILDQLTFGAKVDSPDAIKVPVLLAVALLKDRNGVIQFDLPVSGSLDDPEFSVGGIVFRAIINLLVKIVTSPFALLGSLGHGHGEELAYIEFAPGSAALDAPSEEKLKAISKALADRPALKLDVVGRADPVADRDGLKRSALEHQVKQQKFNDLARRGEPPASVDAIEVPESEYEALLTRVYKDAKFDKPRNAIGLAKDLPKAEMETLLLANVTISDEDMRLLAERRAQAVRASLVDDQHVPGERVFLVSPRLNAEDIKDKGKPTRVDFALH